MKTLSIRTTWNRCGRALLFCLICTLLSGAACVSSYSTSSGPLRFKNREQESLWRHARSFLGKPYRYGGTGAGGMDCSGLVVRLYQDIYGTRLPHKTRDLYVRSSPVPPRVAEVGDLVFFRIGTGAQPAHVGVYMGRGEFIHASSSRGVILSRLDETYYRQRFMCFRRIGPG